MRGQAAKRSWRAALITALCWCALAGVACPQDRTAQTADPSLKNFLRSYLGDAASSPGDDTRYAAAVVALSGQSPDELVVYVMGRQWCGSGGCTTLVLAPKGPSYKVIARITITQLPIRILATRTNGWHDIGVWVQGGGTQPGYEARLRFNRHRYPSNPTVPPARRLRSGAIGEVVIPSTAEGIPLNP